MNSTDNSSNIPQILDKYFTMNINQSFSGKLESYFKESYRSGGIYDFIHSLNLKIEQCWVFSFFKFMLSQASSSESTEKSSNQMIYYVEHSKKYRHKIIFLLHIIVYIHIHKNTQNHDQYFIMKPIEFLIHIHDVQEYIFFMLFL